MRIPGMRCRLRQIMLAVAVLAWLFVVFGVAAAVAIVVLIAAPTTPVLLVGRERKLPAAAWVACFFPLLWFPALHATWFTAWLVLGHRPGSASFEPPRHLGPIVDVPKRLTDLLVIGGLYSFAPWFGLMFARHLRDLRSEERRPQRRARTVVMTLAYLTAWLAPWVIVGSDLFGTRSIWKWFVS